MLEYLKLIVPNNKKAMNNLKGIKLAYGISLCPDEYKELDNFSTIKDKKRWLSQNFPNIKAEFFRKKDFYGKDEDEEFHIYYHKNSLSEFSEEIFIWHFYPEIMEEKMQEASTELIALIEKIYLDKEDQPPEQPSWIIFIEEDSID